MTTDIINLILIIPLLVLTMYLTSRGQLPGLLFWPGVIMMIIYHYTAYVFELSFDWISLLHFTILVLSIYILVAIVAHIDSEQVRSQCSGLVFEKLSGLTLFIFGVFMFLRFLLHIIYSVPSA